MVSGRSHDLVGFPIYTTVSSTGIMPVGCMLGESQVNSRHPMRLEAISLKTSIVCCSWFLVWSWATLSCSQVNVLDL